MAIYSYGDLQPLVRLQRLHVRVPEVRAGVALEAVDELAALRRDARLSRP